MGWEVQSLFSIGPDHCHLPVHPPQPGAGAAWAGLATEQLPTPFSALPLECPALAPAQATTILSGSPPCLTLAPAKSASKMQRGTWVQVPAQPLPAVSPRASCLASLGLRALTCPAATSQGCCGVR